MITRRSLFGFALVPLAPPMTTDQRAAALGAFKAMQTDLELRKRLKYLMAQRFIDETKLQINTLAGKKALECVRAIHAIETHAVAWVQGVIDWPGMDEKLTGGNVG